MNPVCDGKSIILTINGGSSSIKFALFSSIDLDVPLLKGAVTNIGVNTRFEYSDLRSDVHSNLHLKAENPEVVIAFLLGWIDRQPLSKGIEAIGHRVVHGMNHTGPELISNELLLELSQFISVDPDHLPLQIKLIEGCASKFPGALQIACFDTSFHSAMPTIAQLLPLPSRYFDKGIRRYGFHGLSYQYLMHELEAKQISAAAKHNVILAHLGSGSSLVAVKDGIPIDTTMGFSPNSGVMMGSRTGDIDPGLVNYLLQTEGLTSQQLNTLVNRESGLHGISGISDDVLDLLTHEKKNAAAGRAIDLYCYQIKKAIGSLTAVLGGLDTIIFSGGIGQNSPVIRRRICQGLQHLGIELDEERNIRNEEMISTRFRNVDVRVIPTNEEWVMVRNVSELLARCLPKKESLLSHV